MTRKLIALVDGSAHSASVCEAAAWIAGRADMPVELMHVLGRREGDDDADLSGLIALGARSALLNGLTELDEKRAKLAAERGRAILEDALDLVRQAGADATTHLRHGDVVDAISDRQGDADMVVVGKRGESPQSERTRLGTHLERVMRSVAKPLFVTVSDFRPVKRVLVAYDGSPSAMRAVDHIARSPVYAGLQVSVVTFGQDTEAARRKLSDAQSTLAGGGFDAETEVRPGNPDTALGELLAEGRHDHVVMGSSGHTRFRAFFVGSTTMEMLRASPVPILLVK